MRDVVAIARGIWWSLNGRIDRIVAAEAARLLPEAYRGLYLTPEASENRVLQNAAGTDDATGSNNWALARQPDRQRQAAAVRRSASAVLGAVVAGTNTRCMGRRMMPPAQVILAFPACGGAATALIAWAITNNMASTRDLYVEEVDPRDPRRYRDGDTWRAFDERHLSIKVRGEAARRTDNPLDRARPGGERAGAVARSRPAIRRCRCAGSAWSTWTTSAPPIAVTRATRLGRFPRGVARLVGCDLQLRLCRRERAYRLSDGGTHSDPWPRRAGLS